MVKSTTAVASEAVASLYRASLDSFDEALLILRDGDSTFAFANTAALSLLGYSAEAVAKSTPDDLFKVVQSSPSDPARVDLPVGGRWPGAWRARCADGMLMPVVVTATRLTGVGATLLRVEPRLSRRFPASRREGSALTGQDSFALLSAASTVLTSTTDYEVALNELTRLALPTLGIACVVHVLDAEGGLVRVADSHLDGETSPAAVTSPELAELPLEVLRFGGPLIRHAGTENLELLPDGMFVSGLALPIELRGDVLGALSFLTDESERQYDADDVALGQELARRVALAMDAARLLEREQRRRRQLEAVREVAAELTNELDLSRLLDLIIRRVAQLVDDAPGILYIWDEDSQRLIPRSMYRSENLPEPTPIPLGEGVSGIAAREHRTVVVEDYRAWDHAIPRLRERTSIGAALAAPVMYQARLVGVITLAREVGDPPFTPGQRDLVGLFADHAAVAIEHARLFEREQERLRQLEAIREVSTEVTRELDLPTLLELIWRRAAELVDGDRGALFLWDEQAEVMRPCVSPPGVDEVRDLRLKLGEGAVGRVAQTRQGIVINDYRAWRSALPSILRASPAVAFMAEPMVYQDRLIGVFGIGRSEPDRPFTERDQETLRLFGQHAAIAIENARLFEQEQKRRRQVEAIRDVAAEIARELDLVRVLELTFQRANDLIRGSLGWVYLWDDVGEVLLPWATTAPLAREFSQRLRLGQGATGMAAERRQGVIVNNYPEWEYAVLRLPEEPHPQAALAAPILYQDRLVGVITLIRLDENDPFTADELALLSLFADHAAIAIENARLYQQEQRERQQLEAIRDLTSDIIRELELERVLELTIDRATSLVNGHTGVVFEWDADATVLKPRTVAGFDRSYPRPILHLGQGISGRVAQTLQGVIENDYANSSSRLAYVLEQVDMRSAMAAPIVLKDRLIGVVTIGRTTPDAPFDAKDLELLCLFADHAAIAIEHARLYAELSDRAGQMKTLVGKLLRAQDEERRRVAYEVHDGLAQVAAATHQHLEAFSARHQPHTEQGRKELDAARQTAQQTVREARRVIAGLRPTVLDDLGLASALRQEIDALKKDGFTVSYEENLGSRRLAQEVETTLFSIGREALTNVRKHAGVTRVEVRLAIQPTSINLEVHDWGRGFDSTPDRARLEGRERIGLRGMEERVAWLGGQLTLESRKGKGARVAVSVPLEMPPSGRQA